MIKQYHHKVKRKEAVSSPYMSTSIQTSAAEAHLTEGQFLVEEHLMNKEKSLIFRAGTRRERWKTPNSNIIIIL
jgi:hypothetical protein